MESLVGAKEPMKQLESMIIGREPMANGITFVQHEINSKCKGTSKAQRNQQSNKWNTNGINDIIDNCKGTNDISIWNQL